MEKKKKGSVSSKVGRGSFSNSKPDLPYSGGKTTETLLALWTSVSTEVKLDGFLGSLAIS